MEILSAIVIFALFDYFGYITSLNKGWVNDKIINPYRITQALVQILISVLLFFYSGLISVISFNLLWLFWVADWIFYIFCLIFNYKNSRKDWLQPFKGKVYWAYWTIPTGLSLLIYDNFVRNKNRTDVKQIYIRGLSGYILLVQSLLGVIIVLFLSLLK